MDTRQSCPICGGTRMILIHDALSHRLPATDQGLRQRVVFDAQVCEICGHAEFYLSEPLEVDGRVVQRLDSPSESESQLLDPWEGEESVDDPLYYEPEWEIDDFDNAEVSRVEKRPLGRFEAEVVLVDLGPRPEAVLELLRGTLGLTIPDETWLRSAMPFVVLDRISPDAAGGLARLLQDVGATAEVHSFHEE